MYRIFGSKHSREKEKKEKERPKSGEKKMKKLGRDRVYLKTNKEELLSLRAGIKAL